MTKPRPVIFKWRQSEPAVILMAVGWYLRFSLSYRDVEELLIERGLDTDHVTIWRWVQRCAPELERRLRAHLKSTNKSWRVDETFVRVKGRWAYLYRAVDSTGAERSGNSLAISRGRLMARLREAQEHPEWRWERERRQTIRDRVDSLRPTGSRSQVPVTPALRKQVETVASIGLPSTIRFEPGCLTIACRDMQHLVEQLVLVAKSLDSDYERLQGMVELPARKKPQSGASSHAVAAAAAAS